MLSIQLFQALEVRDGQEEICRNSRKLFAYLLLNSPVSPEEILKNLFPAKSPPNTFHKSLGRLKKGLGRWGGIIQTVNDKISLNLQGAYVDVHKFQKLLRDGSLASLEAAIDIYRGELLDNWDEPWIEAKKIELENAYRNALEKIVANPSLQDDPRRIIHLILQSGMPRSIWSWEQLVAARIQAGDITEALGDYRQYQDWLKAENNRRGTSLRPSNELGEKIQKVFELEEIRLQSKIAQPTMPQSNHPLSYLESTVGSVPMDSPYYIQREIEPSLFSYLQGFDTPQLPLEKTLLIKGSRHTGKTSMLHRALAHCKQAGAQVVFSDWGNLSSQAQNDENKFYFLLADEFSRQLKMPVLTPDGFQLFTDASLNFSHFVENHVLEEPETSIVWAIDECDALFSSPFSEKVFLLMRAWHNHRTYTDSPYRRLTMLIAYSTEAHLFIRDLSSSPFNVGEKFITEDFNRSQVDALYRQYDLPLGSLPRHGEQFLFDLTQGHPFLTRRCLQHLRATKGQVADLVRQVERESSIFAEHFARIRAAFSNNRPMKEVVRAFLQEGIVPEEEDFIHLCASGLMAGESRATMRPRCHIYDIFLNRYFQ